MNTPSTHKSSHNIYPGEFVPKMDEETVKKEFNDIAGSGIIHPAVNMHETDKGYFIEVSVPGISSEDLQVIVDDRVLSICVVHKDARVNQGLSFQLHEFDHEFFEREIEIPENTDTAFISAKYKNGILFLHLPKTDRQEPGKHTRIVVY